MRRLEKYLPINIDESLSDSRSLIMPHQSEAIEAMTKYFKVHEEVANRAGIVVMPTGSGKTYTAVNWLLSCGVANGYRIVWLVHRQELVEQTYNEFRKQAPLLKETNVKKLRVLPVSGVHLKMSMVNRADVYVCSIASAANKYGYRFIERMLGSQGKRRVIVVIDEAHHSVSASYRKVLNRINKLNPNMILLGLTATPVRMNDAEQQRLQTMYHINYNLQKHIGVNGYVYEVTLKHLLDSGFLAVPKYIPVYTQIIGEIEYQCTEEDEAFFNQFGELSEQIKNQIARSSVRNQIILKQYLDNKKEYGKTIIFAVNQLHAETLCKEFRAAGVSCDYAVSSRADAQTVIQSFKDNKFDVLINVQILTEGSDIPDIQTVFLTRQTNSDSLLMQMIGRGLRGVKAGGTEFAYIIAFHDTWNTFAHYLDPGNLSIFEDMIDENDEEENEIIEIAPCEQESEPKNQEEPHETEEFDGVTFRDLYLKIYNSIRASLILNEGNVIFPVGWYSIVDSNGNDFSMVVYDSQLKCYEEISRNLSLIIGKLTPDMLLKAYFSNVDVLPNIEEMALFLDYINDDRNMPPFFEFKERDMLAPEKIAARMIKLYEKEEDREAWLKQLYNKSPILQQVYKLFYAFRKTVFDTLKEKTEAVIIEDDDRQEYNIVDNYFNLSELLNEVIEMYPKLSTKGLVRIGWSNNIVRSWYALCQKFDDISDETLYQLTVNKILSSPNVDKEVIKYLIFHELLHQNGYWNHDDEFRKREWQYPNSAELDGFLDSLIFEYDLDIHYSNSVFNEIPELQLSTESAKEPVFNRNASGVHEGFKYCRNCGNKLPSESKFCDKCGSKTEY